jgi:hypothetical protein
MWAACAIHHLFVLGMVLSRQVATIPPQRVFSQVLSQGNRVCQSHCEDVAARRKGGEGIRRGCRLRPAYVR